jgi:peptidoglycan pentaglycine glycine transferase (the first glycine)
MPTYLLQWEGMRWAKQVGCTSYDMWGAPDRLDPSDRMYGVYKFKDGFGASLVETPGAFDLPLKPWIYRLYTSGMPLVLSIMRRAGRASTRQSLD